MTRGRGRGTYGSGERGVGGGQQWIAKGTSSGSGGRSSFHKDHVTDGLNVYQNNEIPSSGRRSINDMKTEYGDSNPVNGRAKFYTKESTRGNDYLQERSYAPVRSKEDHVGQSHQGGAAPGGSCSYSRSCGGTAGAGSTGQTGVNSNHLSDRAWSTVHNIDGSKIQLSNSQLKEVEKGTDFINERKKAANVCRGQTGQPSNSEFITKPEGKETHASDKKFTHVSGNLCLEPSGGRGSSNCMQTEDWDKEPVNDRVKNFSNERSTGNSYWQGGSYAPVRSKEDYVRKSHQVRAAPEGSFSFPGSCDSSAASTGKTGVNFPHLSGQVRGNVHDIDVSKIQISSSQLKEVGKGANFVNEGNRPSQGATGQPSNPGFINKHEGKETHVSGKYFTSHVSENKCLEPPDETESYDICLPKSGISVTLKPSLLEKNREKRNEIKRANEGRRGEILGPGLILLKSHIPIPDQVEIVNVCRRLGRGPGGFYQPGYRGGGKLQLKMMCLGKNWDPEMSQYVDVRPVDGAKPPPLPSEFSRGVQVALQQSHQLIKEREKNTKVDNILPSMSPDLCIVNFYTASGRLGLHQDRDESEESLRKGLPVVSFSIGDTAEFLYSEQRDADKADKVLLESGDVLIFGGKSRHIFHGVEKVLPNTAPKSLLAETNLRPGRLNLTFRQY